MPTSLEKNLSISNLFEGDLQLSSPPNIYFELQKTIDSPHKNNKDAAFIIEKDASFSLRLLKIVNSSFYGFTSQITSIDRAINLVGTTEMQNLLLSTIVLDKFSDTSNPFFSMHDFWARNLRCALIAQEIDIYLGNEFSESIFICGILHNVGQLVLFRRIPELANQVFLINHHEDHLSAKDEIETEINIIGFDHFQVGAALTKLWKLPDIITESIKLHAYADDTGNFYKIAAIIRLADDYSRIDRDYCKITANSFDINPEDMSHIIELAHLKFEDVFKIFYQG